MTIRNRRGRLERAGQLSNAQQAACIVPRLCNMTAKAVRVRDGAAAKQAAVLLQLQHMHGMAEAQVHLDVGPSCCCMMRWCANPPVLALGLPILVAS